ncbi:hypothetical protein D3P07_06775 [Paenibacillus sp. 1011MAR3C5]|uniref:hypothetical protein n=1 Tax=Paenibacillus sp. 1011MAR3C5 TaxID=1675787 RepID=UPI000E6C315F|nr:hypothetical protein [Paenibacillus sp. 1011MAR3C5]RJE89922.1 hypothetical protein D3P07_06775 [Paenibacillus sp. 1011MAR3C5]
MQRAGRHGASRQGAKLEDGPGGTAFEPGDDDPVRGRRKACVKGLPSADGLRSGSAACANLNRVVRQLEVCAAGIWVVPREYKLSSHVGREFFAFFQNKIARRRQEE